TNGHIAKITDAYGRQVKYTVSGYSNDFVQDANYQVYQELDTVSQIAPTSVATPATRFTYGYSKVWNGVINPNNMQHEKVQFLGTVQVPAPDPTSPPVSATRQ